MATLSSGVLLISKPSDLNVPPWQMVSALLGGQPLRVASWWADPEIPTTSATTAVTCWDPSLGKPGAVEIATTGTWQGKTLGLDGVSEPDGNHAKVGVANYTRYSKPLISSELNQQGPSGAAIKGHVSGRLPAPLRHFRRHEPARDAFGTPLRQQPKRARGTILCRPGSQIVP